MALETLLFYNHFGCGDLHCSRELVKFFIDHSVANRYLYAHKQSDRLLLDLPVEQISLKPELDLRKSFLHDPRNGVLCLNTWYGVSPTMNEWRCTLNCLYALFTSHLRQHDFKFDLPPIESFIPTIDFTKYQTEVAAKFLANDVRRRVLISNGECMSGQTRMDSGVFEQVISAFIDAHPDILFFLTNSSSLVRRNVLYTSDVIGLPTGTSDLCENAFLSTQCDVVVGRGSGTYTFAYLKENFLNPKKTMVCFTDDSRTAQWVYPTEIMKARLLWSNNYDAASMRALLEVALT